MWDLIVSVPDHCLSFYFEPSQSLDGAKTGDPREKPPDHPQAQLGLSHM